MLLEEVRDEDKTNRLLFKVLIEEDSLIISAKARGNKGPTLINIEKIIGSYVDSIYRLDLKRSKKSMTRNGMLNLDMMKILKELNNRTLLGKNRKKYFTLMIMQIYQHKDINFEKDDFDKIIVEVFGEEVHNING